MVRTTIRQASAFAGANMQLEFNVPLINTGQHSVMTVEVQVSMQTVQVLQHICILPQMPKHVLSCCQTCFQAVRFMMVDSRVMMGGTSKHMTSFALQKLFSIGTAWVTRQERHACDLGHLQACMPAEGITPLGEGLLHHPVHPDAMGLLHSGTTTACDS